MESKPLAIGTVLRSRYRITRLVAGGGMAWVYKVEERVADGRRQIWAMKELRADADDAHSMEEGRQLFRQEANILVKLRHHNLPRVCAFFEDHGRSYLVMEFIHGESLEKRLAHANAPLLQSQVIDWAVQVCDVLTYLHSRPQPVIFRDMKPSNIMVTLEGRIKLIDFGIARTYKIGKRRDTITMGSENYAAPEQWGKAQSDARADIYGLGATVYHLLTNVPPLPAFVPSPRVPVQQYNQSVSAAMVAIVDRAMEHDRKRRFASAQEMRTALIAAASRRDRRRLTLYAHPANTQLGSTSHPPATEGVVRHTPIPTAQPPNRQASTKACPECGTLNRCLARFCRRCGHAMIPPMPPILSLIEPAGARWEFPLTGAGALVGRPGGERPVDLDMTFYDPEGYISRNHAHIAVSNRRHHITDLGSANGTFVNGTALIANVPQSLRHGDRVRLGRVVLEFRIRGA